MPRDLILPPIEPDKPSALSDLWRRMTTTQVPLGGANAFLKLFTDAREPEHDVLPESASLADIGGAITSILPEFAQDKTVNRFYDALGGKEYGTGRELGPIERFFNLNPAIGAEGGGVVAPAARKGSTTLGTFAGVKSKTADLGKLEQAKRMLEAGESAKPDGRIRQVTGWFKEPGGDWQYEISDVGSFVTQHPIEANRYTMVHPKLFEAYPELEDMPVHRLREDTHEQGWYGRGGMYPDSGEIGLRGGMTTKELRSTGLHEFNHAVQDIEGFPAGAMPYKADPREVAWAENRIRELDKKEAFDGLTDAEKREHQTVTNQLEGIRLAEKNAIHDYRRTLGEFSSRDVQARADYPDWKREAVPPYSSEKIPEYIIRRDMPKNGAASAEPPPKDPIPSVDPEVAAAVIHRSLFDYTRLGDVPQVPQVDLPRNVPARGPSERVQALDDKRIVKRFNETVAKGAKDGIPWYNTEPLRRAFVDEFGLEEGGRRYSLYMDMVAATSPRSDVGTNARNASYYYSQALKGEPAGDPWPQPYGHVAQNLHVQNYNNVMLHGGMGPETTFPVLKNPKPPSFSQNLQGNQQPVTADTHYVRNWGVSSKSPEWLLPSFKADKDAPTIHPREMVESGKVKLKKAEPVWWEGMPRPNEYPMLEMLGQREARKMGMTPAQYQASAWVGAGADTGLASGADPFLRHFENRVRLTADKTGLTPQEVLNRFMHGKLTLLSAPVVPVPRLPGDDEPENKTPGDPPPKTPPKKAAPVSLESLIGVL